MTRYIALIRKEAKSAFGVDFPDFPGCISAGRSLDDALANAREALALHIEGLIEDGGTLPSASGLDEIMTDPRNRAAAAVLIDTPAALGRVARVNITLDESILRRIDDAAARAGTSRSGFLVRSALDRIGQLEDSAAVAYEHEKVGKTRGHRGLLKKNVRAAAKRVSRRS